ncbi:MAG TPA: hypothetical protein VFW38_05130 [Solirubrobacteraceae bacterium]|nr:hypothetical protein [Solirubrobacteraceae bacterium]
MLRRPIVLAGAVAPALTALVLALACPTPSAATSPAQSTPTESGSPISDQGSSYRFRSYITAIVPSFPGLQVEVLEFADRLILRNHTGKTVTVYGYSGEPYARVQPDGTTEQNTRSPAVYLNTSFYANVTVPPGANAADPPAWTVVDRTGELEWHDHRIHWMSPATPPEVKDTAKRTKIFDWRVPIRVGTRSGAIEGMLFWVPEEGTKTPLAAIVALVAIVLGGLAFVLVVRRRRGSGDSAPDPPAGEAW